MRNFESDFFKWLAGGRSPWPRFAIAPLLWLAASPVFAQQATLQGQVQDQSNAVLPGASVIATRVETGDTRSVLTNESGSFSIPLLQPGTYTVAVKKSGFRPISRSQIKLFRRDLFTGGTVSGIQVA